jgi:transcriptional regulator with XRE-family HTH domain
MIEWPLNWRAVVDEAVARRKSEGLTQRELAALAGVSLPTIVSFEKGEIRLRFERIVAILQTLGMFDRPDEAGSLHAFIGAARRRWAELVAALPSDHPSRQPDGHSEQAYLVEGAEPPRSLAELRDMLGQAPRTTGWPPFWVATRDALRPTAQGGELECWLGNPDNDHAFGDAAHSDYWRVRRDGAAYLQRGYQEDGPDLEPGTIFDLTLPIWRTAEVLMHAAWLSRSLGAPLEAPIRLAVRYTGLEGRTLFAWAKPLLKTGLDRTHRSRSSMVDLSAATSRDELERDLEAVVARILQPLYERFDGYQLPSGLVGSQVAELRHNIEKTARRSSRG